MNQKRLKERLERLIEPATLKAAMVATVNGIGEQIRAGKRKDSPAAWEIIAAGAVATLAAAMTTNGVYTDARIAGESLALLFLETWNELRAEALGETPRDPDTHHAV